MGMAIAFLLSPSAVWYTSYFVRSGRTGVGFGTVRNFGRDNYNWSKSASIYKNGTWSTQSYHLGFDESGTYPSAGPNARWYGFPVRCLVY